MDRSTEIREFLRTRRARITPERAGLAPHPGVRRVPGLRREEVAQLAGVSVDYYVRLERGRTQGVSDAVLEAVARALQLDDTERAHLFDLAQPTATRSRRRRPLSPQRVRPVVYRALDSLATPAIVLGRRMDVLAANRLGYALFTDFQDRPHRERNFARYVFLDEAARALYADYWDTAAGDCVATLHLYAGRHPDDPQLTELIGELSVHSEVFRRMWADHDVLAHTTGTKRLHHPLVGDLTLDYVVLTVEGDPDQNLTVLTPEPASPSAEALDILASWTHTSDGQASGGTTRNSSRPITPSADPERA
ncbi:MULTISPECIES: helix-turn-helix transcriptional regulator [unclassified Streptomyces]|uniref:helix-turn-helix transcriptional regulator n=1 Tax=unclassified Streptomyces TaxID=2593676 RepID=UPI00190D49DE|nr:MULTISPECIES: helix-turn-helix transcriptional regulator [unclassified Streptomyces]MBK3566423.1 helix-turn-helix domain-containing protein [Streptomyces sp. MBT62]MBK6016325.1 helix-turn-helix domain-containing protein [Streptomyces sp. MBT53]